MASAKLPPDWQRKRRRPSAQLRAIEQGLAQKPDLLRGLCVSDLVQVYGLAKSTARKVLAQARQQQGRVH